MKTNLFLASLGLTLTFLVFSPTEIYFRNADEFDIIAWELLATGVGLSITLSIAMFTLLNVAVRVLPAGYAARITAVLMSFGLAAFLQGTYLGWGFGVFDGSEIDWSQPLGLKIIGVCFWLLPLLLPQVLETFRTERLVRAICLVLLAIQTALLGVQLASHDYSLSYKDYTVDMSRLMQFSADQNAIIVVLDEFQCDIFEEVLERHPKLAQALAGFTYFPDAVAASMYTFPSVPALLTGEYYDNSMTAGQYISQAYQEKSLPAQLRQAGVRSELYPVIAGTVLAAPEVADNAIVRSYSLRSYSRTVYFGMLRAFPVWLKRQTIYFKDWLKNRLSIASNADWRDRWDMVAFRDALPAARAVDQPRTFKFIHLEGLHVPIHLDENLNEIEVSYSRETVIRQATGVVRLLDTFVRRLMALGIYDRSVIVVTGDHGSGRSEDMWLAPSDNTQKDFNRFKARGCPLLLAKPANAGIGALAVSSAEVTLTDIPPTILEELNIPFANSSNMISGMPGGVAFSPARSLFSVDENETRIRGYYAYDWEQHEPLYLAPISEFIIEGNVRNDAAWRAGRTFIAE